MASAPTDPSVLAVCQSQAAVERAVRLLGPLGAAVVGPGHLRSALKLIARREQPVVYLIDVGKTTLAAALVARLRRTPWIIDTGDRAYELARTTGSHGRLERQLIKVGERFLLKGACRVVVRGHGHLEFVRRTRAEVIRDLAPANAGPLDHVAAKKALGLEDRFVVGLVGSLVYAPRLGTSYGWDIVEALPLCPNDVVALVVGDGDGRARLEARAEQLGVAGRCRFVGRVDAEDVARLIAAMDVGVSTQTNNSVGMVRTTGKLPLYLACGLPVLATAVGEAELLLGPMGWTLPYTGEVDPQYPGRLADAIRRWRSDPEGASARRDAALAIHRSAFDVEELRNRAKRVLADCTPGLHPR